MLTILAQKKFALTITFPNELRAENLEVYVDNGKTLEKIKVQLQSGNKAFLSGDYYSIYAAINLQYKKDTTSAAKVFGSWLFLKEKPAKIKFLPTDAMDSPIENYSLRNVQDFKREQQEMANYDSANGRQVQEYEDKNWDKIFSGNDNEVKHYYFNVLRKARARKKLEYITKYPNSYYSFYSFRSDIAKSGIPSDSLLKIFTDIFPDSFKYSDEGNFVKDFLYARIPNQREEHFIDFTAKDISGNTVVLSQFLGKKNVLLHFWATWCSPCMEELPILKDLITRFNQEDLQIISIASKSANQNDFVKATKKYDMNWINIYNNIDLVNKYGSYPVPRICVINKEGKTVYDSYILQHNDAQLTQLAQTLNSLTK